MELAFKHWGPASGPISERLIFLHGMGGTGSLWRPLAASLEDRYGILAPDQRGHGGSLVPTVSGGRNLPHYGPLDYGRDVIDTMEKTGFHPAWLIGHSMGVRSACAAAHLKPDWVRGLILIDLGFSGAAGGGLGDNLATFMRILPTEFASRAEARTFMEAHCPDPAIAQYLMAVSTPIEGGRIHFPFDHAALIETIRAAKNSSVREWIEELLKHDMPILILRGARSLVWSHEEFEAERDRFDRFPTIEFKEIEGAGHGLPFEQRPLFLKTLEEFIRRYPVDLGGGAT
ncbi:MAG: alpha/beta hydrolase [Oligoflexia bacterium]|nr:alpha/beta hydrolase [Oligoflexia bacterium]